MIKRKKQFQRLEAERREIVEYLLTECSLIQGNYSELLVKCGRSGCHCEKEPIHLIARLGMKNALGNLVNMLVRVDDRERVVDLVNKYKEHKKQLRRLLEIQDEQKKILKDIIGDKNIGYQ